LDYKTNRYGVALGSNIGDRLANLKQARQLLLDKVPEISKMSCAGVYECPPVKCPKGSEDFYNTVIEFTAAVDAPELLEICQEIELEMGREPLRDRKKNGPRIMDIDILYAGEETFRVKATVEHPEKGLIIPHKEMHKRRFVLQPLFDLRPYLSIGWNSFSYTSNSRRA